jgi:hypothetical protein
MTPSVDTYRQLSDLPATFTRPGAPYTQLIDSLNNGMLYFTQGVDAILAQGFNAAQFGWLDVWGAIFDVLRNADESDGAYRLRISRTVLAWVGTVPSIQQWGTEMLGVQVTVTENANGLGYTLTFPGTVTSAAIAVFLASLVRVRPAGVPFTSFQQQIGLYLDTINFLDTPDVVGSYLSDGSIPIAPAFSALTNNTQPLLPEYYFIDPILNGQLP